MSGSDDWGEWSKYVLEGMKSLQVGQKELQKEFADLRSRIVEKDAKQDKEWGAQIAQAKERIASNKEAIDGHKWFLRAIMGITVIAVFSGVVGTINSCILSNGTNSSEATEAVEEEVVNRASNSVVTEEVIWVDRIE